MFNLCLFPQKKGHLVFGQRFKTASTRSCKETKITGNINRYLTYKFEIHLVLFQKVIFLCLVVRERRPELHQILLTIILHCEANFNEYFYT